MDPADIGVVMLVMAEAPQAYSAFLPSIMTIRTFVDDEGAVADIREGEVLGSAFVGLIGVAGAMLTGSPFPLLVAVLTAAVMVAVYEYALKGRRGNYNMAGGTASAPDRIA